MKKKKKKRNGDMIQFIDTFLKGHPVHQSDEMSYEVYNIVIYDLFQAKMFNLNLSILCI